LFDLKEGLELMGYKKLDSEILAKSVVPDGDFTIYSSKLKKELMKKAIEEEEEDEELEAYKKVAYNWSLAFRYITIEYSKTLEKFKRSHYNPIDEGRFHRKSLKKSLRNSLRKALKKKSKKFSKNHNKTSRH